MVVAAAAHVALLVEHERLKQCRRVHVAGAVLLAAAVSRQDESIGGNAARMTELLIESL